MNNRDKNKKIKCVFFVTGLDNGGIENYLLRFLNHERAILEKTFVYCKAGKFGQLEDSFRLIPNVTLIKQRIGYINIIDHIRLYFFFRKVKPTSICDFTGDFSGLILFIGMLSRIPNRISFYRNSSIRYKSNKLKRYYNNLLNRLTLKYSTQLLSNSYAAIDYFFRNNSYAKLKFGVIYNGIDSKKFLLEKKSINEDLNIPKNSFIVGHVGRYNSAKNHNTLIDVAINLCKSNFDIYFILCGNDVKNNLQERVDNENLHSRILLFNNYKNIVEVFNSIHCFYFPSITEGQPNALIEAMISGIPIVASNIPSILETVPKNHHSSLIDPYDIISAQDKIMNIKENNFELINPVTIQKMYNADEQFEKFTKHLIKND